MTRSLTEPFSTAPAQVRPSTWAHRQAGGSEPAWPAVSAGATARRPHAHMPPEKRSNEAGPEQTAERVGPTKKGCVLRNNEKL